MSGSNDPRVNKGESDQMVESIRDKGLEVDYIVYPGTSNPRTSLLPLRLTTRLCPRKLSQPWGQN